MPYASDYHAERAAAFADVDVYDPSNGAAAFGRAFGGRVNVCRRTTGCVLGYCHAGACTPLYEPPTAPAPRRTRTPRQPVDPTAPTIETIRELLDRSDAAVERALVVLYARQTTEEQATSTTREHNGRGFNGTDAELLSSFAQQIERGRHLTAKQLVWARRKVRKYAGQLLEEALAKRARKGAPAPVPAVPMCDSCGQQPAAAGDAYCTTCQG